MNSDVDPPQELDAEAIRRTLDEMRRLFVVPELERRRLTQEFPQPVELSGFQVLWNNGAESPPTVRINDEVRTILGVDVPSREGLVVGQPIVLDATSRIEAIHLHPEEEQFAHFTAVHVGRKWFYSFDFRHQKRAARDHLLAAEEFLQTAQSARAAGATRAFLENAHSVLELVVKIELLLLSVIGTGRIQHPEIRDKASRLFHIQDTHGLLARLAALRLPARYLVGSLQVQSSELDDIERGLDEAMGHARARSATYGPTRGPSNGSP